MVAIPMRFLKLIKIQVKFYQNWKSDFPNKDWEAITSDGENFIYGDFGNNAGNRKDLAIYKTDFQGNYSKIPLIILHKTIFYAISFS